jgi:hypothetical protein
MIISKTINVKIYHQNRDYYQKLGYDVDSSDIIEISTSDLTPGSNLEVQARCDVCSTDVIIKYKLYNRSISKGDKFACSRKCADIKRREILLDEYGVDNISQLDSTKINRKRTIKKKYGVDHSFQSSEVKNKIKSTLMSKYGVDNYTKTDEYKEKVNSTNLEKYGVEWSLQSDSVKEKSKETNLDKYGHEYPSQSDVVKDKIRSTNIERYGFHSPLMSDDIKEKSRKTLIKNYGVTNPLKSDIIKKRVRETNLEKYGVEYPIQSDKIKQNRIDSNISIWGHENNTMSEEHHMKNTKIGSDENYLEYIGDKISLFKCNMGHNFKIHTDNYFSRMYQKLPLCTVCYPINDKISIREKELYEFISSIYDGEIIQSHRDVLEIDVYLPELKIGFEYNGLYWHSSDKKDKNYHLSKTQHFLDRGIRIIHIWEDDWIYKTDIQKSMISNIVNKTPERIFARKCEVISITDNKSIRNFLDENHIQGYTKTIKLAISLMYNGEIYSIMTFDKSEGRKKMTEYGWNLSRFCNKLNTQVVGGASKLLSFFIKEYNPNRIISYADASWSSGNLYNEIGFKEVNRTNPDYKYIIDGTRRHKSSFRKSSLKIDVKISEREFMESNGYHRIYDCGKIKFELLR